MSYDIVVGVGCSFMNGDCILDIDGNWIGKHHQPQKYLSEELGCDFVNLARTGASNERIFISIYDWVESNTEYKNPLFIIGLTALPRMLIRNDKQKTYFDLHPHSFYDYTKEGMNKKNLQVSNGIANLKDFINWGKFYMKWIYNQNLEMKKLQRNVMMLHHYLKGNNCDYRIHNSLEDFLGNIKDKINYISFKDETYNGHDTWRDYLTWQLESVDEFNFNDYTNRSDKPPHGLRFCLGHPSPNANKEFAQRIHRSLK